ncbi:hypothetical protein H4219_004883 [Mycoemilia scoparia]|uniref:BAG domain-containing protein n=1 Tax=Mycoemilia scoparia TaxID=417184 RepID=A0A9W7ZQ60_9FUNG|nr:hypothetical protein H4219_004883 [Mycoemilia scoparia]
MTEIITPSTFYFNNNNDRFRHFFPYSSHNKHHPRVVRGHDFSIFNPMMMNYYEARPCYGVQRQPEIYTNRHQYSQPTPSSTLLSSSSRQPSIVFYTPQSETQHGEDKSYIIPSPYANRRSSYCAPNVHQIRHQQQRQSQGLLDSLLMSLVEDSNSDEDDRDLEAEYLEYQRQQVIQERQRQQQLQKVHQRIQHAKRLREQRQKEEEEERYRLEQHKRQQRWLDYLARLKQQEQERQELERQQLKKQEAIEKAFALALGLQQRQRQADSTNSTATKKEKRQIDDEVAANNPNNSHHDYCARKQSKSNIDSDCCADSIQSQRKKKMRFLSELLGVDFGTDSVNSDDNDNSGDSKHQQQEQSKNKEKPVETSRKVADELEKSATIAISDPASSSLFASFAVPVTIVMGQKTSANTNNSSSNVSRSQPQQEQQPKADSKTIGESLADNTPSTTVSDIPEFLKHWESPSSISSGQNYDDQVDTETDIDHDIEIIKVPKVNSNSSVKVNIEPADDNTTTTNTSYSSSSSSDEEDFESLPIDQRQKIIQNSLEQIQELRNKFSDQKSQIPATWSSADNGTDGVNGDSSPSPRDTEMFMRGLINNLEKLVIQADTVSSHGGNQQIRRERKKLVKDIQKILEQLDQRSSSNSEND